MERHPADRLAALCRAILEAAGSSPNEADLVATHLVDANLAGHDSHGVGMIPAYVGQLREGLYVANQEPAVVRDEGAVVVVDARRGLGQHMARLALDLAIPRAKALGACVLSLRHSAHVGRIGAYGEYCGANGLASTHFVNVIDHDPVVAPFGGSDGRFVTNPFCAGLPHGEGAFPLLDMATSTIALGKARVARNQGVPVPDGTLLDAEGRPTTDATALIDHHEGALTAFGQHKGSGLAVMCELLAGALGGGGTVQPEHPRQQSIVNNMLSVLIDPAALGDPAAIAREAEAFQAYVKASPPAPGTDRVLLPGEPEARQRAERRRDGIPVDEMTMTQIVEAADSVGIGSAEAAQLLSGA
ncbi:MAG: malate/lactate/ureidoglycolate dehydrogenase [Pseudomonadota bacterium]